MSTTTPAPQESPRALPLRLAYAFAAVNGLDSEAAAIRDMDIEWDSYSSSLRRGYIVELFESRGVFDKFKDQHWPLGNSATGETNRRRYLRIKAQYQAFLDGRGPEPPVGESDEAESDEDVLVFPLEAHLRDFLAKNPHLIESGLKVFSSEEHDGVEYPVDNGRIDLLAIDSQGKFVVVELKLSHGRNKALGQLLYYMGWVDQHLGNGPCRGLIIASEITDDLAVAATRVPGVRLAKYRMNFSIDPMT